jgi:ABC-type glucose/galactose transport system permease subunit
VDRERHGFVGGLVFGLVGIGILVISAIALLIAPIVVWFAWNVLDFGKSIGAGDLGVWGSSCSRSSWWGAPSSGS